MAPILVPPTPTFEVRGFYLLRDDLERLLSDGPATYCQHEEFLPWTSTSNVDDLFSRRVESFSVGGLLVTRLGWGGRCAARFSGDAATVQAFLSSLMTRGRYLRARPDDCRLVNRTRHDMSTRAQHLMAQISSAAISGIVGNIAWIALGALGTLVLTHKL